jgi:hypothetical protein
VYWNRFGGVGAGRGEMEFRKDERVCVKRSILNGNVFDL